MKFNPFVGHYLFHFHTSYTDGHLSVRECFEFALKTGINSLIFLEHIRRTPTYDVRAFVASIRQETQEKGLRAYVGFEAKLLPDGSLDISEENFDLADVIGIAEHGFPDNAELLESSFGRAVGVCVSRAPEKSFVWVHPGLWFRKRKTNPETSQVFGRMLQGAQNSGVFIERNLRYALVAEESIPLIRPELLISGADAHTASDFDAWRAIQ